MVPDWTIFIFGCGVTAMVVIGAYRMVDAQQRESVAAFLAECFPRFKRAAMADPGLVQILRGPGPFTVFVTPDHVRGAGERGDAIAASDHVVFGRVTAADLRSRSRLATIDGREIAVSIDEAGELIVGGARLINADYDCANGIVHVITQSIQLAEASAPDGAKDAVKAPNSGASTVQAA